VGAEVAPLAQRPDPGREAAGLGAELAVVLLSGAGVPGDRLRLLDLALERLTAVLVDHDPTGGHVVQLDPDALAAEHLPHRRGVEGQRQ